MACAHPFCSENNLDNPLFQNDLAHFWQSVTQGTLIGKDNIQLAWCSVIHPQSDKAIVICSGRVESYLKYQELIYDLYQQGYSVYALDHRGQGLSQRLTNNPNKGHVNKFSDYIDDFATFINQIVMPQNHQKLYLVGHSMGGAIGTLYLKQYPKTFKAAALSAPMYGIKLPVNKKLIQIVAAWLDNSKKGQEANYVLGGKDYQPVDFKHNELTNSKTRFNHYKTLYQSNHKLQLGAPTNHWLVEAITASEQAITAAKESKTPIIIFQAENDTIVNNASQNKAISEHCQKLVIPSAKHEIYIETDNRRNMALTAMFNFFNTHK